MTAKTKRERFENVAGSRVQMVLEKLDSLSKCANKKNYEFGKDDVDKMFKAINDEVKRIKMLFETEIDAGSKDKKIFKF